MGVGGNRYLYNGKEKVGGTGLYAYGFRYYNPATARFIGVDPISDKFAFVSVYNYAENEPIAHIDLHGLQKIRYDVTWDDPGIRAATRGQGFKEIKAMRDEYAGHLANYGGAVAGGFAAGAGLAWMGLRALPAVGRYVLTNPVTTLTAVKTSGEFAIGLFDEAGQFQLPGGVDDAGRTLKVGVSEFMERNMKRIGDKIGGKIGKAGHLPFEPSKEGYSEAVNTIRSTLNNPSAVSELFENSNGVKVFDVFNETTGMTVRIGEDGVFNTLIKEATPAIKNITK